MLEMESRSYEYFLPKHKKKKKKKNAIILHFTVGDTVKFLLCCVQHPNKKLIFIEQVIPNTLRNTEMEESKQKQTI